MAGSLLTELRELERELAEKEKTLFSLEEADHDEDRRWRRRLKREIADLGTRISELRKRLNAPAGQGILLPFSPEIVLATFNFQQLLTEIELRPQETLYQLSPRKFEELIADLWHRFGYEVELTKRTRDGGRDIIAVRRAEANLRLLIECKRYEADRKVDVRLVRQLYGTKIHEGATKAILATTSCFTTPAKCFFDAHWWELEPRDYDGILAWVKLANERQLP